MNVSLLISLARMTREAKKQRDQAVKQPRPSWLQNQIGIGHLEISAQKVLVKEYDNISLIW
jgi:hypothetical protein